MILVTGATGFIGRALIRQLFETGRQVRVLIRPSRRSPRLPKGVPVEVAVVSLADDKAIQTALKDVDTIIHLAGSESQGRDAKLSAVDMRGTQNLSRAAAEAGVKRMIYISHLGASRSSGFPVFKAKGIAEEHIRRSGVPFTIIRTSLVFGPEDHFTTSLARLLQMSPFFFPFPSGERTVIQPLWVEDLASVIMWSLNNENTLNQTYEIGGSEYFTIRQILEIIMQATHRPHLLFELHPVLLRALIVTLETFVPNYPASSFWLDYVSISRTCPVDNLPDAFGLMPARFAYRLDYLKRTPWYAEFWDRAIKRISETTGKVLESIRTFRL
ncbi:MAG: NAD(P)H-binding protein [Chloroflexi bacterium]|nr:NAD(P)H-binding protein [Chloroflexota bacterium]